MVLANERSIERNVLVQHPFEHGTVITGMGICYKRE
jgi:hypothetical protein